SVLHGTAKRPHPDGAHAPMKPGNAKVARLEQQQTSTSSTTATGSKSNTNPAVSAAQARGKQVGKGTAPPSPPLDEGRRRIREAYKRLGLNPTTNVHK
ncbi:unnamed protein product, partial [Amoebophrya sp. A25]